jgi:D-alanine-D-alanine ligase-like ATP-grasp enzyme
MARVDMMLVPGNTAHIIEINGVPGFSEASIVPKQAAAVGLNKRALVTRLLQAAAL